ncbi:MAG: signal peptidase I [Acidobacteriota bacterium]
MAPKDGAKVGVAEADVLPKGTLRDYWETICVVLIFVLFARTWVFQNSNIPSGSMKNTLLVGDRLIVNSFLYGPSTFDWERKILPMRDIRRGDIVVFKFPGNPQVPFIKRVVAMPGDVIQLVNHKVFLNGKMLVEGYTLLPEPYRGTYESVPEIPEGTEVPELPDFLKTPEAFRVDYLPDRVQVSLKGKDGLDALDRGNFGPYRIPEGHLFMMGDNRMNSEDSRYWGALDARMVLGRAWVVWWSFKEGDYDYLRNSPGDVARRFLDKIVHFFGKTRWDRIFMRPR